MNENSLQNAMEGIVEELSKLSFPQKAAFSAACSERVINFYDDFSTFAKDKRKVIQGCPPLLDRHRPFLTDVL